MTKAESEKIKQKNQELFAALQRGDESAKAELLNLNMPLVTVVLKATYSQKFKNEAEDLFEAGVSGLLQAINQYDAKISLFSTFAYKCIRREMLTYIRHNADASNVSIYAPENIDEDDDSPLIIDKLESEEMGYEDFETREMFAALKNLAKRRLTPRQYQLLEERYFSASEHQTCVQIAKKFETIKQNISQLEPRALRNLRIAYDNSVNDEKLGVDKSYFKTMLQDPKVIAKLKPYIQTRLSKRHRAIIVGEYVTIPPKTSDQMANELGISRKTVKAYENEAIRKLKQYYEGTEED